MKNNLKYISALALATVIIPFAAQAHGGDDDFSGRVRMESRFEDNNSSRAVDLDKLLDEKSNLQFRSGKVTAVATNSFTMQASDGKIYTVDTTNATFNLPFNVKFNSTIAVNDNVKVKGTLNGLNIVAKLVLVTPQNTQSAKAKGTVTAVNGSNLTVQTKGGNTVTVATDSNTTVTKADGSAGTVSNVTVGSNVSIKGLWNSLTNVFNALKIKLHL